jgi:hypothetical protein
MITRWGVAVLVTKLPGRGHNGHVFEEGTDAK